MGLYDSMDLEPIDVHDLIVTFVNSYLMTSKRIEL
jgi:hypothetical protein